MPAGVLLQLGATITFAWGVTRVIPASNMVNVFGPPTEDKRRNIIFLPLSR